MVEFVSSIVSALLTITRVMNDGTYRIIAKHAVVVNDSTRSIELGEINVVVLLHTLS